MCACGEDRALDRINKSGAITMITRNNPQCYYSYRNQDMGFEYDLAKAFAEYLGVELKVVACKSCSQVLPSLHKKRGHFVAASLTRTPSRFRLGDFSEEYLAVTQQVLTHKNNRVVNTVEDLEGKTIHVPGETSYAERLKKLRRRRLDLTIQVHHGVSPEKLIEDVAKGRIQITVADSNVALLNRRYYPDLRIAFPIGKPLSLCWAVNKGEYALLRKINDFFHKAKEDGTFDEIYKRYYAYPDKFDHLDVKRFQQRIKTRFPKYEHIIKETCEKYGFDWRLVAALIYQESQFDPQAVSVTGVRGLMQLTLPTAEEMGVKNRLDPHQSIVGGVRYLRRIYNMYENTPEPDRTLIALAAYNVGNGHIQDARIIASESQLNPDKWSVLEKTLPLLRHSKHYKTSKFGYCRGTEPVFHVQRIMTYFEILKRDAIEFEFECAMKQRKGKGKGSAVFAPVVQAKRTGNSPSSRARKTASLRNPTPL